MFIFNNTRNGRSHEVDAYKVRDFIDLVTEARKTEGEHAGFDINYYDASGKQVLVDNEPTFKKIKQRDDSFYIFELVTPRSPGKTAEPVTTVPPEAQAVLPFPSPPSTPQPPVTDPMDIMLVRGAPFIRKIEDCPMEVTEIDNKLATEDAVSHIPHYLDLDQIGPRGEFQLVESNLGRSSFGTMSQLDFNMIVSQNDSIKQVNESIQDLEGEMRMAMEELKLTLSQAQTTPTEAGQREKALEIHKGIRCDICGKNPIRGKRFKCIICRDYDLCMACERTNNHIHPMLRLAVPAHQATISLSRHAALLKTTYDKLTDCQRRKFILKFYAGRTYEEQFYDQFLAKNGELSFGAFVQKVAQIFS